MEVELQNTQRVTSSDYWSLASNQYPSGKFPKVSIGITISKAGSVSRGRDAATTPILESNLSQGTDGRSRISKDDKTLPQVSPKAASHDGPAKETTEADIGKRASLQQSDDNTPEQLGTFSFGTRRGQGGHLDPAERSPFLSSQGKHREECTDKSMPNSDVLRMKLWEILGGSSQNKQAAPSPNPDGTKTPDQQRSQGVNGTVKRSTSENKQAFTSNPVDIRTPDQRNSQTVNFTKGKPFSDPIESDSDSPKLVEPRPFTRSSARKKGPSTCKQQGKGQSAKKPLSPLCSAPKQKMLDDVFVFNEKRKPRTVGKSTTGGSGSLRNLRSSKKKAKMEPQKINFSERISDKITQDEREAKLPSPMKVPSENKGNVSFSSFSRTGKTAESCSNSSKRERSMNTIAKVGPQKVQFSESLLGKTMTDVEEKLSSKRTPSKSKENDSFSSLPNQSKHDTSKIPEASDISLHSHKVVGNIFISSPPSGAAGTCGFANQSPEPKTYPWKHASSPEINGIFGQSKVTSTLVDKFRDMPDDSPSPTFAANVNITPQRSKLLDEDLHSPKYPKSLNRSRSGSFASDPESESLDGMDKTDELPGVKSPNSAEERESREQPPLSPISPMEDEGAQSFVPRFRKGYKSRKWFSKVDSPKKSPFELPSGKAHLKQDKLGKRSLSSLPPFPTSGTEETIISDKESVQCPENYLTRAFEQLIVVLGRFQTKIKSETSNKRSEILAATSEIIHQHLEGVELQMQADVDKLVSAGKSKRKRLESAFEEQQEKLRVLHKKFREEVNQQLLDCRSSLDDFEAYHAELKGAADKQKVSHKKLLLNAEKTVGAQLNEAETKIAEVQKRARKRMNGLKYVLKELITEASD